MTDLRWPTQVRGNTTKAAGAASWLNRLLDACKMGTIVNVVVTGGSGKMVQRPEGTTIIIDPKVVGGGGGLNLRGEWDATQSGGVYVTTYSINDVVVISLGINQGSFVWIGTASGNSPPYTGGQNWMQLPGGALGQWF